MYSDRPEARVLLKEGKLPITPLTIFQDLDPELGYFWVTYKSDEVEEPFFEYNPSLREIIFPNGRISVHNWGIIDGSVDGVYWVMEKSNRWQNFGDMIIKIERSEIDNDYPKFSILITDMLNTKVQVLNEKLLNELLSEYESLEDLIYLYMEGKDQQLKESIAQAVRFVSPPSNDFLIATATLPEQEDVKKILNKDKLLEAGRLSLIFGCRFRVAAPEEREEIESLS